jgi:hypothetical protein
MTSTPGEDAIDGMKMDVRGNLYVSSPGGVWILSPEGKHLGTIILPKHPHNFNWGDADGRTLYLCAQSGCIACHPSWKEFAHEDNAQISADRNGRHELTGSGGLSDSGPCGVVYF